MQRLREAFGGGLFRLRGGWLRGGGRGAFGRFSLRQQGRQPKQPGRQGPEAQAERPKRQPGPGFALLRTKLHREGEHEKQDHQCQKKG